LKTLGLHPVNRRFGQVVDQNQVVLNRRPDIDVPAVHVFKPQPGNGPQKRFRAPRAWEHVGVKPTRRGRHPDETKLKNLRLHGLNLLSDRLARLNYFVFVRPYI
jgi:hypothetical protein